MPTSWSGLTFIGARNESAVSVSNTRGYSRVARSDGAREADGSVGYPSARAVGYANIHDDELRSPFRRCRRPAIGERSYQQSVAFAHERPRVARSARPSSLAVIEHPSAADVVEMKAYVEAMRASAMTRGRHR